MISLIIPCYNAWDLLETALLSISTCSADANHEVVLVDDASPQAIPADMLRRLPAPRLIRQEQNLGFVRTANRGAQDARGDILVFLNQDTEFLSPGWDVELRKVFAELPAVGIVGAKLVYPDSGLVQFAGGYLDGEEWKSDYLYYRADPADPLVNRERQVDWVLGAFLAVRREVFERLGGFASIYHSTYEDIDLCLRAAELGWRTWYRPSIVLHHFETATGLSGLHQSDSLAVFRRRWHELLSGEQPDYYREDGLDGPFVRRLMALCQRDFCNVRRVIDRCGLAVPELQAAFIAGRSALEILDRLTADPVLAADPARSFHYYRARAALAAGKQAEALADLSTVVREGRPSLQRDECRLLLELLGESVAPEADFFSSRLVPLGSLIRHIDEGGTAALSAPDIQGQAVLTRLLEMVQDTLRLMPQGRLDRLVEFVEARAEWFANRAALASLMFRLANMDFQHRGEQWFGQARRWVAERSWDPVKTAQFVINEASYLEKTGRMAEALAALERIHEPLPRSLRASLHYHLGECLDRLGDPAGALRHRQLALAANPDNLALRRTIDDQPNR